MVDVEENEDISESYTVHIFSKLEKYSIPETLFTVPKKSHSKDLNKIINHIKQEEDSEWEPVKFNFLINGKLLKTSLRKHLIDEDKGIEKITVEVIESLTFKEEESLEHNDWIASVRAHDNWILTGGFDNSLYLWDLNGKNLKAIPAHRLPIQSVAWIETENDNKSFAATSMDGSVTVWKWNPQKPSKAKCIAIGKGDKLSGGINCINVHSSKEKFLTGSADGTIRLWSLTEPSVKEEGDENAPPKKKTKNDKEIKNINPQIKIAAHRDMGGDVLGIQWLNSTECCTGSMDHSVKIWNMETGTLKQSMEGKESILTLSYSPLSQTILTGHISGAVKLWDPRQSVSYVTCNYKGSMRQANSIDWSSTNENLYVTAYDDNYVRLWDVRSSQKCLNKLSCHDDMAKCVDWTLPSHIISGGADKKVRIFTVNNI